MIQRIISCLLILLGSAPMIISCNNDDEPEINTFSAIVDVADSSIPDSKYSAMVLYSTDGGLTFVEHPLLKKGDSYKVKAVDRTDHGDVDLVTDNCFAVDWSASNPQPTSDPGSDVADFVMGADNSLSAKITNLYVPFNAGSWGGEWVGDEDGACCSSHDDNVLRQDPSNPNKYIMDNFWGDGVDAYIIFTPSTGLGNQFVDLPEQTTSEGGVASGSGTYDQCAGTFTIATTYVLDGGTYVFDYNFHR